MDSAVVLILAGATYVMRRNLLSNPGPKERVVLAILPFQNLSNDPGQEYFSDGLTEETVSDLGQLSPDGGFEKGNVWVTSQGCPVQIVLDEEIHGKDGSPIGNTHYEEAMIKKQ